MVEHKGHGWLAIYINTESRDFCGGEESKLYRFSRMLRVAIMTVANVLTRGGRTGEKKKN